MTSIVSQQSVSSFTVGICAAGGNIVGTGFVVSPDGKIITCAHVVREAGVDPAIIGGAAIGVLLPFLADHHRQPRQATIAACFSGYDDDIVMLHLVGTPLTLDPQHVARLGTARYAAGHPFSSYGYRRLQAYQGLPAHGTIAGLADIPDNRTLQHKPVMLTSQNIDSGMSGAAVLDETRNLVIGVVAETWDAGRSHKDRDTAFAVAADLLALPPFSIPVQTAPPTDVPAAAPVVPAGSNQIIIARKKSRVRDVDMQGGPGSDQQVTADDQSDIEQARMRARRASTQQITAEDKSEVTDVNLDDREGDPT